MIEQKHLEVLKKMAAWERLGAAESTDPRLAAKWAARAEALEAALVALSGPSNDQLLAWAARNPPPQSWYDEDHTGLFQGKNGEIIRLDATEGMCKAVRFDEPAQADEAVVVEGKP